MTTISQPRAHTRVSPPPSVSWWHVVVTLEKGGYTHASIGAAVGRSRTTVTGWKNLEAQPTHVDGERLIALWRVVTGKAREDVPVRTEDILSAAAFR